jgi:hypothetical protein
VDATAFGGVVAAGVGTITATGFAGTDLVAWTTAGAAAGLLTVLATEESATGNRAGSLADEFAAVFTGSNGTGSDGRTGPSVFFAGSLWLTCTIGEDAATAGLVTEPVGGVVPTTPPAAARASSGLGATEILAAATGTSAGRDDLTTEVSADATTGLAATGFWV